MGEGWRTRLGTQGGWAAATVAKVSPGHYGYNTATSTVTDPLNSTLWLDSWHDHYFENVYTLPASLI